MVNVWDLSCVPSQGSIFCDGGMQVVVTVTHAGGGVAPPVGMQVEAIGFDDSVVSVDPGVAGTTPKGERNFRISCTGKHCDEQFTVTFHAFEAPDATFTGTCKKAKTETPAVRVLVEVGGNRIEPLVELPRPGAVLSAPKGEPPKRG